MNIELIKNIIVILIFALVCIYLFKKGQKAKINKMLFYLVLEAEKHFGGGTGELKFHAVTTWIYERLPSLVTFIFTDKQIDKMIEEAVEDMKEYLKKNSKAKLLIIE